MTSDRVQIHVMVDWPVAEALANESKVTELSQAVIVRRALAEYLERRTTRAKKSK